ncbi:MAG: hypothetical protein NC127_05265 [Muribaculum sp.]|nr:hypothetical protein [Muribaculum sp.]
MDVAITAPEGNFHFVDITPNSKTAQLDVNPDLRMPGCGHKYPNIGWIYDAAFVSDDDNAVLLFPTVMGYMAQLDRVLELEIQASHNDTNLDVRKYLTVIADKDMSQYANADTVIVYQYDILGMPYMDKYKHVIGVYLRKYAHPSLMLKIVTNGEGLAKKDEYVKQLVKCVKYGNEISEEALKWEKDYPGKITILDNNPSHTQEHQH